MEFEWDPAKAAGNFSRHGVSFAEAVTVFGDSLGATFADPEHSVEEHRFIVIGRSNRGRLPTVAHSERNHRVRIIRTRKLTQRERNAYEETWE